MHNIIGDTINGTLHGWAVNPHSWDNLLYFYGILFIYVGYKALKYFGETARELAESKEERDKEIGYWVNVLIGAIPLATLIFIVWYFDLWKH